MPSATMKSAPANRVRADLPALSLDWWAVIVALIAAGLVALPFLPTIPW
jgi:hypothetical protein